MSFDVAAEAYDRFMGRYSVPLAPQMADFAGVEAGQRVLDVGCGPGALTSELVSRVGAVNVAAADPSEPFVEAVAARNPGIVALRATAEDLPFPDRSFDATLAQLVVHFMADAVAGLAEMARVTRSGGLVAACVWDHGGARGPLRDFWACARELAPGVDDGSRLAGVRQGNLAELMRAAGLHDVAEATLSVRVEHASFESWWQPFTGGVGPAGAFVASLTPERQTELRELCRTRLPAAPFVLTAIAWAARGRP